jgi:hypothetical protein
MERSGYSEQLNGGINFLTTGSIHPDRRARSFSGIETCQVRFFHSYSSFPWPSEVPDVTF